MKSLPKAYVLHCKSLESREAYMRNKLEELGLESCWITQYDAAELDPVIKQQYYAADKPEALRRAMRVWGPGSHQDRYLADGEVSIAIKHTLAMESIASADEEMALVLEDDCLFHDRFQTLFYEYLSKTPNDWDVIHIGDGYGMRPERYKSIHSEIAYRMNHPASRCAEAILVRKRAASLISSTMKPFYLAADWELGYQYWLHNLTVYWWDPALVTQGSHSGFFESSLR